MQNFRGKAETEHHLPLELVMGGGTEFVFEEIAFGWFADDPVFSQATSSYFFGSPILFPTSSPFVSTVRFKITSTVLRRKYMLVLRNTSASINQTSYLTAAVALFTLLGMY